MLELRGSSGGIAAPNGMLLDGEFMNSRIVGNTTAAFWSDSPTGNGIAGGDYRSIFSVGVSRLQLVVNPSSISEFNGQTTATITRQNPDDLLASQSVFISSSDTTEAITPASITIPAGQASVTFTINAIDDDILDGTQTVALRASASGFVQAEALLQVTDYEALQINLTAASMSEKGGTITGRLIRPNASGGLVASITSSLPGKASVPTTVTFADGQLQSAEFTIAAIDNNLLDGPKAVTIRATAVGGYVDATATITVDDFEPLTLAIAPEVISEEGGVATATITRTDSNGSQLVLLSTPTPSQVSFPSSVTIPAGALSATFTITALADGLVDGTQTVTVRAIASGYVDASAGVQVTDAEKLVLTAVASTFSENGGRTTGRVRRTDPRGDLVVQLAPSVAGQITVPTTLTIADGQTLSDPFNIDAIDNQLLDGQRSVHLSASATGYVGASITLQLTDHEPLTLQIVGGLQMSEKDGVIQATVVRPDASTAQTISLVSSDLTEATVPATFTLAVGELTSAPFNITAVDDSLLDGTQLVIISASATGYESATARVDVLDYEPLEVHVSVGNLSEQSKSASVTVSRRNLDNNQTLTVQLTSSDSSELLVPSTVTIPAGQNSVTATVLTVDDTLLDGPQTVIVAAQASGYISGLATIVVDDSEMLSLQISLSTVAENAGSVNATVTRGNTDVDQPLTVELASDSVRLAPSPSVTIPAGQVSVTFPIAVIDNQLLDGSASVTITATAAGYNAATASITVTDYETLAVSFSNSEVPERQGSVLATVSRSNTDRSAPLTVQLASSDTTEATVPASVVIPAGSDSVTFTVTAVDDSLLDGLQSVVISASASGYVVGDNTLHVRDFEQLVLSLETSSAWENSQQTTATIRRPNTDMSTALVVQMTVDVPGQVAVPAAVTILANQSQATFTITIIDNSATDGDRPIAITANASGYESGTATLTITDDEGAFPWHNSRNGLDVNNDGFITAIDALLVINQLNTGNGGPLTPPPPGNNLFYDTSADNFVTAIDALLVINYINTHPNGEGESDLETLRKRRAADLIFADFGGW